MNSSPERNTSRFQDTSKILAEGKEKVARRISEVFPMEEERAQKYLDEADTIREKAGIGPTEESHSS